ncbi:dicarboxylate/amino acid:cation symporter [Clostridium taeniosporum]|uniref:Dicarboxylate/amino acid:cation symporter n=1 Tax=Clostridium taeniosporum TaxID=394958 RepID=A0A1D7XIW7_9CLOT|nr:dicarboxylate/amino acid:cation symporter [Clostridium taeniosporum]AOR23130.1 dicarboxylate/amino acid:cation symporter [Clostridium taeniosporum]
MKGKLGLTTKVFIALILGAIFGIILYNFVPSGTFRDVFLIDGVFKIVGKGFLRAMQMLVVPLVFCSLVCGSLAIGDTKKLGKVGIKTMGFYVVTTAIAITVAIGIGKVINPGIGLDMSSVKISEPTIAESKAFSDVILDIIPTNPINALSQGNMLQIIFFAMLVGIILASLGKKTEVVADFFKAGNEIMMKMTMIVMEVAPIGVFCLISTTFATLGWDAFTPMLKYMGAVFLALAIQCLGTYMVMLKGFSGLSPIKFLKKFAPVMSFAFSTATSNATIPLSVDTLDKKIGVSKKISSFTVPLGATINMDGTAIMQGVAVVFVAQAFGINLGVNDYITVILTATLASIGTAGVPGVGLITLSMVFNSVNLPVEGIALIMGIDRILDMTRTAVNITGDAVCTTIVAKQEGEFDKEIFECEEESIDENIVEAL